MKSILTLVMMLALTVCGFARAATDASTIPNVNPVSKTSFVGSGVCETCEQNAFNKANPCYHDQKPVNCPATYEKMVDGAEKAKPAAGSEPTVQ